MDIKMEIKNTYNDLKNGLTPAEWYIILGIFIFAVAIRFIGLELRPPHHDEGVNGWFVIQMWQNGFYKYDPSNYHGPLFFYLLQFSEAIFGKGIFSLRLVPVFFSIVNIILIFLHKKWFGRVAVWAALFLSISPAMVFYGKYAIHETTFVTFQILFAYGFFHYYYNTSRRKGYLYMLIGAFGTFMTKETFFVYLISFGLAFLIAKLSTQFLPARHFPEELFSNQPKSERQGSLPLSYMLGLFLLMFIITMIIYSGFFQNPKGMKDAFGFMQPWIKAGTVTGHSKKWYYWINPIMIKYEWPALIALCSTVLMFFFSSRMLRFWSGLSAGIFIAYSIVPYKTPWIIICIIWPLFMILGYFIEWIIFISNKSKRYVFYSLAIILLLISTAKTLHLNYVDYANIRATYLYTHTDITIRQMLDRLEWLVKKEPSAINLRIRQAIDQTWPLPWALSDYQNRPSGLIATGQKYIDELIIADIKHANQIEANLGDKYYKIHGKLRDAYTDIVFYYKYSVFNEIWDDDTAMILEPSMDPVSDIGEINPVIEEGR